jgi:hypothetical protein
MTSRLGTAKKYAGSAALLLSRATIVRNEAWIASKALMEAAAVHLLSR